MKNNEKYYTPDIKEFRVGFEYEIDSLRSKMISGKGKKFTSKKYKLDASFMNDADELQQMLSDECIRVKILDKQDIKSLGLIVEKKRGGYDQENEYDIKAKHGSIIGEFLPDEAYNIVFLHTLFKIKNKSELNVLLNQLNIEHNGK